MRIIGGQWKRSVLPVLQALGLRPTPDRVRETVFNWINHLRDGDWANAQVLDLFAGSGASTNESQPSQSPVRIMVIPQNKVAPAPETQ